MIKPDYPIHNNILFFFRGIFSQWYGGFKGQEHKLVIPRLFFPDIKQYSYLDGLDITSNISFNCCEQAMMYYKACLFNDCETADKILKEKHPKEQKRLGREVKNYNEEVWAKQRFAAVRRINKFKYQQNPELKEYLLSTGHLILCEANPVDPVWSCGLSADNPLAHDVSTWQGHNLLGRVLMSVREDLNNE